MKLLITGASGMVGQNLIEHPDFQSHTLLRPSSKELNLLNRDAVVEYLKTNTPDFIIHAAGRVGGIQANIKHPVAFLTENMDMGFNLLLAAQAVGIPQLLNLGSSCMYPRNAPNPLKEELVLKGELEPTNEGYAIAKCAVSRLCDYIHSENENLQYKTLIPCNLYGRWDKFDPKNSHLIPAIIAKTLKAVQEGHHSIEIWGDGSARREFMYAEDLADFISLALSRFEELEQLTNVGLGFDYSIKDYYQATAESFSFKGGFAFDLSKPTGMKQKLVDCKRAHALGWKAKTDLKTGISKTIAFYQEEYRGASV